MCLQNFIFGNISSVSKILLAGLAILLFANPLAAEDAGSEECAKVLSEPPFSRLKELSETGRYSLLSTGKFADGSPGLKIIGVKCSSEQIKDYMAVDGWIFELERELYFNNSNIEWDNTMYFCRQKQRGWGPWRENFCSGLAHFNRWQGRIVSVSLGPTK